MSQHSFPQQKKRRVDEERIPIEPAAVTENDKDDNSDVVYWDLEDDDGSSKDDKRCDTSSVEEEDDDEEDDDEEDEEEEEEEDDNEVEDVEISEEDLNYREGNAKRSAAKDNKVNEPHVPQRRKWTKEELAVLIDLVKKGVISKPSDIRKDVPEMEPLFAHGFEVKQVKEKLHTECKNRNSDIYKKIHGAKAGKVFDNQAVSAPVQVEWTDVDMKLLERCLRNIYILAPRNDTYIFFDYPETETLWDKFGRTAIVNKIVSENGVRGSRIDAARLEQQPYWKSSYIAAASKLPTDTLLPISQRPELHREPKSRAPKSLTEAGTQRDVRSRDQRKPRRSTRIETDDQEPPLGSTRMTSTISQLATQSSTEQLEITKAVSSVAGAPHSGAVIVTTDNEPNDDWEQQDYGLDDFVDHNLDQRERECADKARNAAEQQHWENQNQLQSQMQQQLSEELAPVTSAHRQFISVTTSNRILIPITDSYSVLHTLLETGVCEAPTNEAIYHELSQLPTRDKATAAHEFIVVGQYVTGLYFDRTKSAGPKRREIYFICISVEPPEVFMLPPTSSSDSSIEKTIRKLVKQQKVSSYSYGTGGKVCVLKSAIFRSVVVDQLYMKAQQVRDSCAIEKLKSDWNAARSVTSSGVVLQRFIPDRGQKVSKPLKPLYLGQAHIQYLTTPEVAFEKSGLLPRRLYSSKQSTTGIRRKGATYCDGSNVKLTPPPHCSKAGYWRTKLVATFPDIGSDVVDASVLRQGWEGIREDPTLSDDTKDAIAARLCMIHTWSIRHEEPQEVEFDNISFDFDYLCMDATFRPGLDTEVPVLGYDKDPNEFFRSWMNFLPAALAGSREEFEKLGINHSTVRFRLADILVPVRFKTNTGDGKNPIPPRTVQVRIPTADSGSHAFKVVVRLTYKGLGEFDFGKVVKLVWEHITSVRTYLNAIDKMTGGEYNQNDADKHTGANIFTIVECSGGPLLSMLTVLALAFSSRINTNYDIRVCMETYGSKGKGIRCNIGSNNDYEWKDGIVEALNSKGDIAWQEIKNSVKAELFRRACNSPYGFLPRFFDHITGLLSSVDVRFAPGTTCTCRLQGTMTPAVSQFEHVKVSIPGMASMHSGGFEWSPGIYSEADDDEDISDEDDCDPNQPNSAFTTPPSQSVPRFHGGNKLAVYSIAGSVLPAPLSVNTFNFTANTPKNSTRNNLFSIAADEHWLERNRGVTGIRSQVYNGGIRTAIGEISRTEKQSSLVLNLKVATGTEKYNDGFFTNMEKLHQSFVDFHHNAKLTLDKLLRSPSRLEMVCSGITGTEFSLIEFNELVSNAIDMIVDIYALRLVRGYDANVYMSLVDFTLHAMRGFAKATLQLTQVRTTISDTDAAMNEFAFAFSAIRSSYLTFWSGRREPFYQYAAALEPIMRRKLLFPGELVPCVLRSLTDAGATDDRVLTLLALIGCRGDAVSRLSSAISQHKSELLDPSLTQDSSSLYAPKPHRMRNRACICCWRLFITQDMSSNSWETPQSFYSHPCSGRSNESNLVTLHSTQFLRYLHDITQGLNQYQASVIKNIWVSNVVYSAPAGAGKTHTGNIIEMIFAKHYGSEAVIKVSPTWNSAQASRAKTWHQQFKLGIEQFAIYELIHQLKDMEANVANVRTFIETRLKRDGRATTALRLIRNAVLIMIDEFARMKRDIFEWLHLLFCEVRGDYTHLFGGCRVLLLGDPAQCVRDISDQKDYYKNLDAKYKYNGGASARFDVDGFGYCFESPLFSRNAEFGQFIWVVIRSGTTHRFLSNWLAEFTTNRARLGKLRTIDLQQLATFCYPISTDPRNLTTENAYWHLMNLIIYEHHVEHHLNLQLSDVSENDTFESLADNDCCVSGAVAKFEAKCAYSYGGSFVNPKNGVIYRRTREGFNRGLAWRNSREKQRLLQFINTIPANKKRLVAVTETSHVKVANRLFEEMRALLPTDNELLEAHPWTLTYDIKDANNKQRPLTENEMSILNRLRFNAICDDPRVSSTFHETLCVHKHQLYRLTVMDPSENPFVASYSLLEAVSKTSDSKAIIMKEVDDTSSAEIVIKPRSREFICREIRGITLRPGEELYVTITQFPLLYSEALTTNTLAGITTRGRLAFLNSGYMPEGGGYVAVSRCTTEANFIMSHIPKDVDEANAHDFRAPLAYRRLDQYFECRLEESQYGEVPGDFHLKCHYKRGASPPDATPINYEVISTDRSVLREYGLSDEINKTPHSHLKPLKVNFRTPLFRKR